MFQDDYDGFLIHSKKCDKHSAATITDKNTVNSCESSYWYPQFLNEEHPITEYNIEWKKYLLYKNSQEIKKTANCAERFMFYTPETVKCVFNLCKIFRQPPEVRYLAMDILDRFLVAHFLYVGETFERMENSGDDVWEEIIERMLSQSPLRILTCVQLAMKYSWSCNIITVTDIQAVMDFLAPDEQYSKKSIIKSEARIYQHLDYNMAKKTPFTYLEMFFDDLHKNKLFNLNITLQDFFAKCIHVLDVATIFHHKIYGSFQRSALTTSENTAVSLKADFVLLAASVIFASLCLADPHSDPSKVRLGILCSVSECQKSDIEALASHILEVIQSI